MNKTDAWMPLWIGAYLADTMHLSRDEHGGYLLLIMTYWRTREPLPDNDRHLASIIKASPKEWKELRPVLSKFFKVEDGVWTHKRIEQELTSASNKKTKATSKAQAAAQARWKDAPSNAPSNAPSIPTSNSQAMHEDCPTHTPTPTPSISVVESSETHTEIYSEQGNLCIQPGTAGSYCKAIKQSGIQDVNPSNPTLLALIASGATEAEFTHAARSAVEKGILKFNYVIGIVKGQREQAAALVLHKGVLPNKQEALEGGNRAVAATWMPPEMKTGTGGTE